MTLLDIVEMFADWKAASLRQHDGNLLKSITSNVEKFKITGDLIDIFKNTAEFLDRK